LRTGIAYERSSRLTRAEQMDYWTYQDNYPLVSKDGKEAYPVWQVVKQMEDVFAPGTKVAAATASHGELKVLPTVGPRAGQFAVLLVNPIGAGQVTLEGLPRGAALLVVSSTAQVQHQSAPPTPKAITDAQGRVTIAVPARSVVTVHSVPMR
jgi:hypothetical protein